jgi:hypothetical protein
MAQGEVETEDETTEDEGADTTEETTEDEQTETETTDDTETEDEDDDEDEQTDYFTAPIEDEAKPVVEAPKTAAPLADTEDKYVLENLSKIPVNIVVTGADGKDVIQRVEVYGNGDLPANFKGFATPLEAENYRSSLTIQITRALDLRKDYKANATRIEAERTQAEYDLKERRAIAEDLTELRAAELFPHFKGKPGTKEFSESAGGKEFDKVIAFMNKRNDEYIQRASAGKNYRHIGFREAFDMMHGPNPKAAQQAEDKARKTIAAKTKSGRGADAGAKTVKTGRVSNLNDLNAEFLAAYPEGE